MAELQGLCMKCRQKGKEHQIQTMTDIQIEQKGNRYTARGKCSVCGTGMFKFLKKEEAAQFQ